MSEDLPCPIILHHIGQASQSKMFDGKNDMLTNCSGEKGGRQGGEGGGNSRIAIAQSHGSCHLPDCLITSGAIQGTDPLMARRLSSRDAVHRPETVI
jgi:hypothetical protein